MPRCVPECPQIPEKRADGRFETKTYSIQLITPMFGGGVEAGSPDASFPIRGTAIRGQLEFWWRATRGAVYADKDALFERHAAVWGKTECASPVEIEVCDPRTDQPKPCAERIAGTNQVQWKAPFNGQNSALPYALFPFQGTSPNDQNAKNPATFIENASFTLRVRFPKNLREDVETAMWAWVNFGGLGARTRRGCGALLCKDFAPQKASDIEQWFKEHVPSSAGSLRQWTTLPRSILYFENEMTPVKAWDDVIGILKRLRQGTNLGRNPSSDPNNPKKLGRSRWPEPETIRTVTAQRAIRHARQPHIPNNACPRAEFGLPIVFHFQPNPPGNPSDTTLYPDGFAPDGTPRNRMASPLILKPLALANKQAVPMIVRLVTQPLNGVDLRDGSVSLPLPNPTIIRGAGLESYHDSPMQGVPSGSALDTFVDVVMKDWEYREARS